MDKQQLITAVNLSDITMQKLKGIINKIDIVMESDDDRQLGLLLDDILKSQHKVAKFLEEKKAKP